MPDATFFLGIGGLSLSILVFRLIGRIEKLEQRVANLEFRLHVN